MGLSACRYYSQRRLYYGQRVWECDCPGELALSSVWSVCVSLPGWDSVCQISFSPGSVTDLSECQALCACTSGTLGVSVQ